MPVVRRPYAAAQERQGPHLLRVQQLPPVQLYDLGRAGDRNTRFCGVCGSPMEMDTDISKRCPNCGKTLFKRRGQLYCAGEGCGFVKNVEKKGNDGM